MVEVLASPGARARHPNLVGTADAGGVPWHEVDPMLLRSVTETVADQGVVAIAHLTTPDPHALWSASARLIAGLCDVRDPGNAGTVIRCADAAGADGVLLLGESVDPYNGKCVRASAGSLFHLPVLPGMSVADGVAAARGAGLAVLAADGAGDVRLDEAGELLTRPTLWLFGNEAAGLSDHQRALADDVVAIPVHGRAESLNLAAAAVLCLYASAGAQRGSGRGRAGRIPSDPGR